MHDKDATANVADNALTCVTGNVQYALNKICEADFVFCRTIAYKIIVAVAKIFKQSAKQKIIFI